MSDSDRQRGILTPEQAHIITLVARGWTDRRIAVQLNVSVSTVKRRMRAACDALGAHSRIEAALAAKEGGLLNEPEPKGSDGGAGNEHRAREL